MTKTKKTSVSKAKAETKKTERSYPIVSELNADDRTLKLKLSKDQWRLVRSVGNIIKRKPKAVIQRSICFVLSRLYFVRGELASRSRFPAPTKPKKKLGGKNATKLKAVA